jgi:hypothetical protein
MSDSEMVQLPESLSKGVSSFEEMTKHISVKTADERSQIYQTVKDTKTYRARVIDFFAPMKKKAAEAHKAIVAQEKAITDKLDDFEKAAKRAILDFDCEEERKRAAEQRRLQAEADERARKERERLEREAAKLKTPELKEARLEAAAAVVAPVIELAPTVEKQAGESTRKIWKARIVDPKIIPREWLIPNEKGLNDFAKSNKGVMPVAGVEWYYETVMAMR